MALEYNTVVAALWRLGDDILDEARVEDEKLEHGDLKTVSEWKF